MVVSNFITLILPCSLLKRGEMSVILLNGRGLHYQFTHNFVIQRFVGQLLFGREASVGDDVEASRLYISQSGGQTIFKWVSPVFIKPVGNGSIYGQTAVIIPYIFGVDSFEGNWGNYVIHHLKAVHSNRFAVRSFPNKFDIKIGFQVIDQQLRSRSGGGGGDKENAR